MPSMGRREFLSSSTSAVVGLGAYRANGFGKDDDAKTLIPRVNGEVERLVQLISRTARDRLVGVMVDQIRQGISQRSFSGALYVSALRFGRPHRILVHHPVAQLSFDAPRGEQWHSLFWHLDNVKSSPDRVHEVETAKESQIPSARKAVAALETALRQRDVAAAQAAVIAIARSNGPRQACQRLWRQAAGPRNLQIGGHHAIHFANCWRSLEATSWQLAEPVLMNLARESADIRKKFQGRDLDETNDERSQRVDELHPDWAGRPGDTGAVRDVLAVLREANASHACRWVFDQFMQGTLQAGTVWDAIQLASAEFVIRFKLGGGSGQAMHSVTCMNSLQFAFRACADPRVRCYTLLQAVQFQCDFLARYLRAGYLRDMSITEIGEAELPESPQDAVDEIFALLPPRRVEHWFRDRSQVDKATRLAYALARRGMHVDDATGVHRFFRTAQHLLRRKSFEAHDLKAPIAFFENLQWVSPQWRPHLLAASVHNLHGTQMDDNPVVAEAAEALKNL